MVQEDKSREKTERRLEREKQKILFIIIIIWMISRLNCLEIFFFGGGPKFVQLLAYKNVVYLQG